MKEIRIKCTKCVLRPWEKRDIGNLIKYANNKNISKNLRDAFPYPYTKKDALNWLKFLKGKKPVCNFAITIDDKALGGIGFKLGTDIERISAEIGYWLGEPFWGKGIVTSAVNGLVKYGFQTFKLIRIYATPFAYNTASKRVLEKNKFKLEGRQRKAYIKRGKIYDRLLYAKIKE